MVRAPFELLSMQDVHIICTHPWHMHLAFSLKHPRGAPSLCTTSSSTHIIEQRACRLCLPIPTHPYQLHPCCRPRQFKLAVWHRPQYQNKHVLRLLPVGATWHRSEQPLRLHHHPRPRPLQLQVQPRRRRAQPAVVALSVWQSSHRPEATGPSRSERTSIVCSISRRTCEPIAASSLRI